MVAEQKGHGRGRGAEGYLENYQSMLGGSRSFL
jgi:hypothetical protein